MNINRKYKNEFINIIKYKVTMNSKKIYMIVCVDLFNGIAKDNKIPWKFTEDMKWFVKKTTGHHLYFGSTTYKTLDITKFNLEKTKRTINLFNGINNIKDYSFICGGSVIYQFALEYRVCSKLYVTRINKDYECNTFFPKIPYYYELKKTKMIIEDLIVDVYHLVDNPEEKKYLSIMKELISAPIDINRTDTKTRSLYGEQMIIRLDRFPLLTTKKMFWKGIVEELLFFIRGDTDNKILQEKGIHIWDGNSSRKYLDSVGMSDKSEGYMGYMYGYQWNKWGQLDNAITRIKQVLFTEIIDRRIIVSSWNPEDIPKMPLVPCHFVYQFNVRLTKIRKNNDGKLDSMLTADGFQYLAFLDCQITIRSNDWFLGNPFNMSSYALLVYLVCASIGYQGKYKLVPGNLIMNIGNYHLYESHIKAAKEQLTRTPYLLPKLKILNKKENIKDYKMEDIMLLEYKSHSAIKAQMVA